MLTVQHMPMQEPEVLDTIRVLEVARKTEPFKKTKQPAGQVAVKQMCAAMAGCKGLTSGLLALPASPLRLLQSHA